MAPRYFNNGSDFDFKGSDFGFTGSANFTGSARGGKPALNHPVAPDDHEYGNSGAPSPDSGRTGFARGGPVRRAIGGGMPMSGGQLAAAQMAAQSSMPHSIAAPSGRPAGAPAPQSAPTGGALSNATITMPVADAARSAAGLLAAGRAIGARTAGAMPQRPPAGAQTAMAAAPRPAPAPQGVPPTMAHGGHMTARTRNALPSSDFAGPGRSYPINDASHARNALSRVAQNGSPSLQAHVRAKVRSKFPDIGKK